MDKMRVVGYKRVSTFIQMEDGYSLEYQQSEIERYCHEHNLELPTGIEVARIVMPPDNQYMEHCAALTIICKALAKIWRINGRNTPQK